MSGVIDQIREKAKKVEEKVDKALDDASKLEHNIKEGVGKLTEDVKDMAGEHKKKEEKKEEDKEE